MTPVFVRLLQDAGDGDFDVVALHSCGQLGVNDACRYRNTFLLKHVGLYVFEVKHGRASFRDGWSAILGSVRGHLTRKQCGELEEAVCWTSKEQYVEASRYSPCRCSAPFTTEPGVRCHVIGCPHRAGRALTVALHVNRARPGWAVVGPRTRER